MYTFPIDDFLDQYGPVKRMRREHGLEGYQALFLELFKRDIHYTPSFQISRKYKNIARSASYVFWYTR